MLGDAGSSSLHSSTAVWIRRFGSRFAQVGTMMTFPFIAILMIPSGLPFFGALHQLWSGAVAAVAGSVCSTVAAFGEANRFHPDSARHRPASPAATEREKTSPRGVSVSTRMAVHMAAALSSPLSWDIMCLGPTGSGRCSRPTSCVAGTEDSATWSTRAPSA